MRRESDKETIILNVFKTFFFITLVINIFLFVYKHESRVDHANYKILVEDDSGEFVEYEGSAFPTSGYVFDSYECANDGVITQNPSTLKLSFSGGLISAHLNIE